MTIKAVGSGSWRTTAAGLLAVVSAALALVVAPLLDEDPATVARWAEFLPLAATALGLVAARDNVVSSEAAGAAK